MISLLVIVVMLVSAGPTGSDKWSHESEGSVVIATGNSDAQTYAVRQTTGYAWSENKGALGASYLHGIGSGTDTAKKWELGLRYDRTISERLSIFLKDVFDHDRFAGLHNRYSVDLGTGYLLLKSDSDAIGSELGYRFTREVFTSGSELSSHMARAYLHWTRQWNESVSSKVYVEYLQSFSNLNDARINFEPSLSVLLTNALSLKLSYLMNFRNVPAVPTARQLDSLFTTSLVAKF